MKHIKRLRITLSDDDHEFWLHIHAPSGKQAGINLGRLRGNIAAAAIAEVCEKPWRIRAPKGRK